MNSQIGCAVCTASLDYTGNRTQEDFYLKELVRYIHLNPIRAGIINSLDELKSYDYCGHSSLMGREEK